MVSAVIGNEHRSPVVRSSCYHTACVNSIIHCIDITNTMHNIHTHVHHISRPGRNTSSHTDCRLHSLYRSRQRSNCDNKTFNRKDAENTSKHSTEMHAHYSARPPVDLNIRRCVGDSREARLKMWNFKTVCLTDMSDSRAAVCVIQLHNSYNNGVI